MGVLNVFVLSWKIYFSCVFVISIFVFINCFIYLLAYFCFYVSFQSGLLLNFGSLLLFSSSLSCRYFPVLLCRCPFLIVFLYVICIVWVGPRP